MRPLYSPSGRLQEAYIDVPVEPERGEFIDTMRHPQETDSHDSWRSWAAERSHDEAPTSAVRTPSPSSSGRGGSVRSSPAQRVHVVASTSPAQPSSPSSSIRRGREGWWTARGSHDDLPTRPPSPSGRARRAGVWVSWTDSDRAPVSHSWGPSLHGPGSAGSWGTRERTSTPPVQPSSPSSSIRRGREGWWTARGSHDDPLTRPPSSSGRDNRAGIWVSWPVPSSAPVSPSLGSSLHEIDSAGSWRPRERTSTPPVQTSPLVSSSSSSSVSAASSPEHGFVVAAQLEPFAPPMQASTSLLTAITAETDPGQQDHRDGSSSLPVVVVQKRDGSASGSGSWRSRVHSSRASSPKSLASRGLGPPSPRRPFGSQSSRSPPPAPERSRSSPERPRTPLPTVPGRGLGLYIPQQSHSDSLSLSASAPGTQFHTPVEDGVGQGVGTQAYLLNPAPALASTPASASSGRFASMSPRSRSADDLEHRAERILPSVAGPPSMPSESGDDVAVGNGDVGGGEIDLGSRAEDDGAVEFASGKVDSRSRSASVRSNDGGSKRTSRSVGELHQDSGLADVHIDSPPPSPHESRNPDTMAVVLRPSTPDKRPLLVFQDVDTNASTDAYSASMRSNDGESKRTSRSVGELYQDSGLADVHIDSPPPSPHESRNHDTMAVVVRPSTPNQRPLLVIQHVDTDSSTDARSPEREPDTDTPLSSESPTAASDSSL
jgi:hypothetical protein